MKAFDVVSAEAEVFEYPSEDSDKVNKAIEFVIPFKKKVLKERLESEHGASIFKITVKLKKSEARKLLKSIIERLSKKELNEIISTLEKRLNDEGFLFLRFDKQEAYEGKLKLSYSGDVIRIKIRLTSYPLDVKKIITGLREFLNEVV